MPLSTLLSFGLVQILPSLHVNGSDAFSCGVFWLSLGFVLLVLQLQPAWTATAIVWKLVEDHGCD